MTFDAKMSMPLPGKDPSFRSLSDRDVQRPTYCLKSAAARGTVSRIADMYIWVACGNKLKSI